MTRSATPHTILFLDHTAALGGGEIALCDLTRSLDRKRYDPVVVLGAEGPLRDRLVAVGVETHVVPLAADVVHVRKETLGTGGLLRAGANASLLRYARGLAGFIRARRVDLVHTNSLKASLIGGIAGRLARVPVVWHVRDRIEADYLPPPAVAVFRTMARAVPQAVVANSAATLATLRLRTGARAAVVYSGLADVERYMAPPAARRLPSEPLAAIIGRLAPWKGQHVFIEAAEIVLARLPAARFLVVGAPLFGEHAYEQRLRAMVAERHLDHAISFTGFHDDVVSILHSLRVLVHASVTGEPFGQVVAQGMAAGLPVIATAGGAIPELVAHGQTGLIVPPADACAMANALELLLSDTEAARHMGEAGRRRALERFTMAQTLADLEPVYTALLASARPARGSTRRAR